TSSSPDGSSPRGGKGELLAQERLDLADRLRAREAGGLAVPSPAALAGDGGDVELVARGAHADPAVGIGRLGRLADGRGHLGAVDGPQVVDDALRVLLADAELFEVGADEVADDQPPALEQLGPVERLREQLELGELERLVDPLEDALDVDAGLDELGGKPKRLRRRVRVLEPARVGDERDVE